MKIVTISGLKLQYDSINTEITNETIDLIIEIANKAISKRHPDMSISKTDGTKVVVIEPVFSKETVKF